MRTCNLFSLQRPWFNARSSRSTNRHPRLGLVWTAAVRSFSSSLMAFTEQVFEPVVDNAQILVQVQHFLDDWHYRVLHSGLANNADRIKCASLALDLFKAHGIEIAPGEREELIRMKEAEMIKLLVQRMPYELRRTFEHFALQLQLIVSATTRIRYLLEEVKYAESHGEEAVCKAKREVADCLDRGDTGICHQILRQTILEATTEVAELNEMRHGWWKSMNESVNRLLRCSDEAEKAKILLMDVTAQLDEFADQQNRKSKAVLMTMAAGSDKSCMEAVFKAWLCSFLKYKQEKEIHDKFRKQISDAQKRLVEFKVGRKAGVKNVLIRSAADSEKFIKHEIFRTWQKHLADVKEEAALSEHMAMAQQKLATFHEAQQANARKVMLRMTAGQEASLTSMTFQAWQRGVEAIRKQNELEEATKAAEQALAEHMAKKSTEAKNVISRMLGSGDKGLLFMVRGAWNDLYKQDRQERQVNEAIQNATKKFSELSSRQKRIVKNTADRLYVMEEEMQLAFLFNQWLTQAKVERVHRHYSGKYDMKKQQLQFVQNMFKSFANELEQGVNTTPRSQRKSTRSGSQTRGGSAHSTSRGQQVQDMRLQSHPP